MLFEDVTNYNSPRVGWWKNQISIPDLLEFIAFEVSGTDRNQKRSTDQGKFHRQLKKKLLEENDDEEDAKIEEEEDEEDEFPEEESNEFYDIDDTNFAYWLKIKPIIY